MSANSPSSRAPIAGMAVLALRIVVGLAFIAAGGAKGPLNNNCITVCFVERLCSSIHRGIRAG